MTENWSRYSLAALRVMSALLFMQHGLQKFFHYPSVGHAPDPLQLFSLFGVGAILETLGGAALALGLFTRPVAFVLSGQMAVAYFLIHVPIGMGLHNGFFPVVNGGDLAVLFCFVFLHLSLAGPGAWSLDGLRRGRDPQLSTTG